MSRPVDPVRREAIRGEYEPTIEYRRVILWPDGGRTVHDGLSREMAESSFEWAATQSDRARMDGATVLLESRYVERWEEERKAVLGKAEVLPAAPREVQAEMFA